MSGNNITCGQSPVLCPAIGPDFLAAGRRWPLLRPDCQAVTRSPGRTTQSAVRQPYRGSDQPAARPAPRHDRRRDRIHLSRGHEKIPDIFPHVCIPLKKSFGGERHTRHQRRHRLFSGSDLRLVAPPLLLHRIIRFPTIRKQCRRRYCHCCIEGKRPHLTPHTGASTECTRIRISSSWLAISTLTC